MGSKTKETKASFQPFDIAETLDTDEDIADFLAVLMEEGSPREIVAGLGVVARARGMAQLAADVGVSREHLYTSLSERGNPSFSTVLSVIRALKLKLVPVAAGSRD